jgi:uncharacterized protein YbjT (DUF2867 family)
MRILVTGGTGTVGSQVVRELAQRKADVTVLTRNRAKASNLPAGVNSVEGNLLQPETVRRIFRDVDAVFLLNPVSQTEGHEALLALCGMKVSAVKRVVYLSVQDADAAAYLPHFGSKAGVEEGIRRSGIPFTILRPNNFFQNDYWFKDAILQAGIYPQPLGTAGVSRVDVRDIAEAAAEALLNSGHQGQTYDLVGPDAVTGPWTTQVWSRVIGREIKYAGDNLDAWEREQLKYLPDWMVFDFRMMYEHFQKHGLKASDEAVTRVTKLIGHAPRSFEAFAAETAAMWKADAAGAAGA